jgi:hypothetical protein
MRPAANVSAEHCTADPVTLHQCLSVVLVWLGLWNLLAQTSPIEGRCHDMLDLCRRDTCASLTDHHVDPKRESVLD